MLRRVAPRHRSAGIGLTSNLAVRRKDFDELGGFAEDLFVGGRTSTCAGGSSWQADGSPSSTRRSSPNGRNRRSPRSSGARSPTVAAEPCSTGATGTGAPPATASLGQVDRMAHCDAPPAAPSKRQAAVGPWCRDAHRPRAGLVREQGVLSLRSRAGSRSEDGAHRTGGRGPGVNVEWPLRRGRHTGIAGRPADSGPSRRA